MNNLPTQSPVKAGPEITVFGNANYLQTTTTPTVNIGAIMVGDNGDKYVYVKSAGITKGKTVQAPAPVVAFQNLAVATAATAGDVTITVTLGATGVTANQFADGQLFDTLGNTYVIDSHLAADATESLIVKIKGTVMTALTTSNTVSIVTNRYHGAITTPATATSAVVGVGKVDIASGEYGFILKEGEIAVLIDGVPAVGSSVSPSNAVSGAVEDGVIAQGLIGRMVQVGVDTNYKLVAISC